MRSYAPFACPVAALFILASGCKNESNPVSHHTTTQQQKQLLPLRVGNQWSYILTTYDTSGNVQSADTNIVQIVRDTMIQNERWYLVGNSSSAPEIITNRANGLWYLRVGMRWWQAVLYAKYPASVNDSWSGPDSAVVTVTSTNTAVTVPRGTYVCLRYSYFDPHIQAVNQIKNICPGYGIIEDEFYTQTLSGRSYVLTKRELFSIVAGQVPGGAAGQIARTKSYGGVAIW
jgi:hypothetical protein